MPQTLAMTRAVSPAIGRCELTFADRRRIDPRRAAAQHAAYEDALRSAGCSVERLPAADDHPDGVFVEDTAVVLDEIAVITRPGAESRRGETETTASALAAYRRLAEIRGPGTLDGGDVLVSGRDLFVGCSSRSNHDGIRQLEAAVTPFGYRVSRLEVGHCLHLKTAATLIGERLILIDPDRIDDDAFAGHRTVPVAPGEADAANALLVNGHVLLSASGPRTGERLAALGIETTMIANDELAKAEGGLSCCCLLLALATRPQPG
jgi:dimethylargininase